MYLQHLDTHQHLHKVGLRLLPTPSRTPSLLPVVPLTGLCLRILKAILFTFILRRRFIYPLFLEYFTMFAISKSLRFVMLCTWSWKWYPATLKISRLVLPSAFYQPPTHSHPHVITSVSRCASLLLSFHDDPSRPRACHHGSPRNWRLLATYIVPLPSVNYRWLCFDLNRHSPWQAINFHFL